MTSIPFDCLWKGTHIEVVYRTNIKDHHLTAGIYNLLSSKLCNHCGNVRFLNGRCIESVLHRHLVNVDSTFQIGYYYGKQYSKSKKAQNDLLNEHIWGAKGRLEFGRLSEIEYLQYCEALAKGLFLVAKHQYSLLLTADAIVPVPTHKDDRMCNLKAVGIARELGKILANNDINIPILDCLEKTRNEKTMSMGAAEREAAVEDMFAFKPALSVRGKKVILLDDVLITGTVKGKCADILKQNGAEKVWILVAGRNY